MWACPVCSQALEKTERTWRCGEGHSYDCAKEGYVNLLLANQKRSADPGDTREMMLNRRAFLEAGYYQDLASALSQVLQDLKIENLLDCGCGEGYYLQQFLQSEPAVSIWGLDISRDAVRMGSKSLKANANFAVASSFQLPVLSSSVDLVLRVFAPGSIDELKRVLKPQGAFVLIVPGPRHLFSLKQALYDTPTLHDLPEVPEGFECESERRISFELKLPDNEAVNQLLAMTPFVWKGSREAKERLENAAQFTSEADFYIRVYRQNEL